MEQIDDGTLVLSWNKKAEPSGELFNSSSGSSVSDGIDLEHDISFEFIEDVNEQKFERLVKDDKLKTIYKRRHSQALSSESRSNSPTSYVPGKDRKSMANTNRKAFFTDTKHNCINGRYHDSKETKMVEKRIRQNSHTSSSSSLSSTTVNIETDSAILARRQKQIDYGKNTIAYERYVQLVPKNRRVSDQPRTPNKYGKYSRRAFDGLIKIWRKQLHHYDPPDHTSNEDGDENGRDSTSSDSDSA